MQLIYRWLWQLGPGNPMVIRVVQGGSRRSRHLWARMTYLGILILIMIVGLISGSGLGSNVSMGELARSGAAIFSFIAYSQVIAVCLIAPLFMAAAIANEQSGQTFNILLTTPLSNMQIVLGSLLGRLFFILTLLASGLPLFSILLLFGGVPITAIFAAFSIAALVAVVVGSVAVTLAALRRGGRKTVFIFIVAVTGYLIASYALDRAVRQIRPTPATLSIADAADPLLATKSNIAAPTTPGITGIGGGRTTWITPLHPFLVLQASLNDPSYQPPTPDELVGKPRWLRTYLGQPLTTFTILSLTLSLILISFSAIRLRAIGTGAGAGGIGGAGAGFWTRILPPIIQRKLRLSLNTGQRRHPPRTVSHNPIAWRESHTRGNATTAIIARLAYFFIAIGTAFVLIAFYHAGLLPTHMRNFDGTLLDQVEIFRFGLTTLLMLELGIVAMIAIYTSASCVSGEREDGTLDLMLTTPITPRYYIWGKLQGLIGFLSLLLAVPIVTLAMACTYVTIGMILQWPQATTTYYGTFGQIHAPIILPESAILLPMIIVPFIALGVTWGMTFSLKRKTVIGAVLCVLPAMAALLLIAGLCGQGVVNSIPIVGPIINAFSPATGLLMIIQPWTRVTHFATSGLTGHLILAAAAAIAATGYSLFVYLQITKMVNDFDKNIRELSGA